MNDIILVGENHHNGLGLVRSFGLHGIKPYGIIIGKNANKGFLRYSKYWGKFWFADDEKKALDILSQQNFQDKPVLIPYSDGAAQIIDLNLTKLSEKYLCPSIKNIQGEIARLMNKLEQFKLAQQLGLKMLTTESIELENPKIAIPLPIIIKPIVSAEGKKTDIRICFTQEELNDALQYYKQNGYKKALIQKYLVQKKEYVLTGTLFNKTISFSVVKHIRQWPINRGSGSFSKFCTEQKVTQYAKILLKSILNLGYQGPIDIEFFQDNEDTFYLNEINWRSSGRNFVSLYTNVHCEYQYYCYLNNISNDELLINTKEGFSMNEVTDIRHVVFAKLSFLQWNKDRRETKSFTLWYAKDLKPTFIRYIDMFFHGIKNFLKFK